jgi:HD superfamily phosphodiesterase
MAQRPTVTDGRYERCRLNPGSATAAEAQSAWRAGGDRRFVHFYRRLCENKLRKTAMAIKGISVPDTTLARDITQFVRDTESDLLFHHSSRVYYFGAFSGQMAGLHFDPELLYAGAMFHDLGLTHQHSSADERFEVDGANAARAFLQSRGVSSQDLDLVWTAIALHTTPGIPKHMHPIVALVTAGVEMDVLGLAYDDYPDAVRQAVVAEHPRSDHFKDEIIDAFYNGVKNKPDTTFGNVKADVLALKDPHFVRGNFCDVIMRSKWSG